jgi:hypothetical protein
MRFERDPYVELWLEELGARGGVFESMREITRKMKNIMSNRETSKRYLTTRCISLDGSWNQNMVSQGGLLWEKTTTDDR